jgi:FtsH-binding integral membrane protein
MSTNSLSQAFRENWRAWFAEWLVLGLWVFIGTASFTFHWQLERWMLQLLMVLFLVAGFWAARPFMKKKVSFKQQFFWTMLLPFILAVVFAFAWHGVVGDIRV